MRILIGILAVATVGYAALVVLIASQQRRLIYHPFTERVAAREAGLAGFEDVVLTTGDGEKLVGWWKPPEPGRAVLLYFHGNAGSLVNRRERALMLTGEGRGLLMVSYRGYSGSTGSPSEEGLKRDAEAAYRYLASYAPGRIVLYGESLGTGVAARLAATSPVGGLILDAPYSSLVDVARHHFWFLPIDLFLRDRFVSVEAIGAVRAPILMIHGDRDAMIPIELGERLFEAAPQPKHFVRLPGVDHVGTLESGGLPPVRAFVAEVETRFRDSLPPEEPVKEDAAPR